MSTNKEKRLSLIEKVSYGFGDSATNVYVAMAGTFLTAFYTDLVGIAAAAKYHFSQSKRTKKAPKGVFSKVLPTMTQSIQPRSKEKIL